MAFTATNGDPFSVTRLVNAGTCDSVQMFFSSTIGSTIFANYDLTGDGAVTKEGAGVTRSSVEKLGDTGWYRISISFTGNGGVGQSFICTTNDPQADRLPQFTGTGRTFTLAFEQVEKSPYPTPYIPTPTSTASRAYPAASIASTEFDTFFNQDGSAVVMDFTPAAIKGASQLLWQIEASDGRIFLELNNSGNVIFGIESDSATTFNSLGAVEVGKQYRLIFRLEDGDIIATLSNGGFIKSTKNLPSMTSWSFTKSSLKADHYTKRLDYYDEALTDGVLTRFKDYVVEGDSYGSGAGGIGLSQTLIAGGFDPWTSAAGGSTLEAAVARLEALSPQKTVLFIDGSVNGHGTVTQDIAKYQRAYNAANGNIVFVSPVLCAGLAGETDGQYTLDLTAAMLLEGWSVVDGTAIARTLSGVTFTDTQDADDAGYADTAYDALFQADNVHPAQPLMTALTNAALAS